MLHDVQQGKLLKPDGQPARNFIRVGDVVKCKPISGRAFKAKITRILTTDEGMVHEVEVLRNDGKRQIRTFRPERITRLAQSRQEK